MLTSTPSHDGHAHADWTLDRLEKFALARLEQIGNWGRKTLEQTWLFGESLSFIQEKTKKEGTWMEWVKNQPYSHGTASGAIKLYRAIGFDDLESCKGMTVSDLKASLGIIQETPPKRRGKMSTQATVEQPTETALKLHKAETGSTDQGAADQTDGDASEKAKAKSTPSAPEAADREVTTTDYSRPERRKTNEAKVGPKLNSAEFLGQAYSLLLAAETEGVTPDCSDILTDLAAKVAALIQTLNVVSA